MKKTLLSFVFMLAAGALVAQVCTPNPEYADEPFGIWPSAEEGLTVGQIDVVYAQVLDFKIPEDPSEFPPEILAQFPITPPPGTTIDSVIITAVSGLPNGIDWACNSHSSSPCTFYSDTPGCALLSGIPTESDTFDLVITLDIYLYNELTGVIPFQDFDFEDYQLIVEGEGTSVSELAQYGMNLKQNAPNPFSDQTVIEFSLNQPQMVELNVFNLLGKNIHSRSISATGDVNRVELNASELNMSSGIYLYSLSIDGNSATRKMIVK